MKNKNIYTDIIFAERFRARARLAIAWVRNKNNDTPAEAIDRAENDFYAALEWVYGWEAVKDAVLVLCKYPLTSRTCPYDLAERRDYNIWCTRDEWLACRDELIALRKWKLIDLEPSACDDGIYLAIACRPEAVSIIDNIINREEL